MSAPSGALALVLCALLWSTGGVFIKFISASSFAIACLRSATAFLVFFAVLRRPPVFLIRRPDRSVDIRSTFFLWAAAVTYSATMILYCTANKLTTAANTILLQYTNPLYVILFSPMILGEKNSRLDYFTAAGVLAGIVLFFAGDLQGGNLLGNILALLSGVTFGFCTIFMRLQRTTGSENSFMLSHLLTAIVCSPFLFINNGAPQDTVSWIFVILMGVFQMALATLLYARGMEKVKALSASIISMIEPLMNPIWVMLFAKEVPSITCISGGLIILGCIILREFFGSSKKQ